MKKTHPKLRKWGKVLPVLALYSTVGCLPEDGLAQVFGENIVLTSSVVIQSITSIFFNALFGAA